MPAARLLEENDVDHILLEGGAGFLLKEPATVTLDGLRAIFDGVVYNIPGAQLTLSEGYNVVYATTTALAVSSSDVFRASSGVLPLWGITVFNGTIQGTNDLRTWGGTNWDQSDPTIQGVISDTGILNVNPTPGVTGNLPYTNHGTAVQAVISSGGGMTVDPIGGVTGNLPYTNNTAGTQGGLGPNTGGFKSSSYFAFGQASGNSGGSATGTSAITPGGTLSTTLPSGGTWTLVTHFIWGANSGTTGDTYGVQVTYTINGTAHGPAIYQAILNADTFETFAVNINGIAGGATVSIGFAAYNGGTDSTEVFGGYAQLIRTGD